MSAKCDNHRPGNPGYLPRGGACVSCRRRKMRCDGRHPVCSQCERTNRAEDCEYLIGQGPSKVQILEQKIKEVQAQIDKLQNPQAPIAPNARENQNSQTSATMKLHQPYTVTPSVSLVQDPPRQIAENLVNCFLLFAPEFGFFLNIPRFRASMFRDDPVGDPSRPSPALIFSTYAFAIRISNDPLVKPNEEAYLSRALREAALALSNNHPHKLMHSIQAEVLLANYFFSLGKFFEGKHHVANAVSTLLSIGLHKLRTTSPIRLMAMLPPHRDMIEEGERIICAWTVLNLDRSWALALEHTPNFENAHHILESEVDTPWPLDMDEFEQGLLPLSARTSLTVYNFLGGVRTVDIGLSTRAIEAKAVILWDKANALAQKYSDNSARTQAQFNELVHEFTAINTIIEDLNTSVPAPAQILQYSPEKARRLGVAYSIINLAIMCLHRPFLTENIASRQKRLEAALMTMEIVLYLMPEHPSHINPIMGIVWAEAAQIILDEITIIRSSYSPSSFSGGPDERLFGKLYPALVAMNSFATHVPFLRFQVNRIEEACRAFQ